MINKDEEIKMNVFSKVAVIAGLVGATTFAVAGTFRPWTCWEPAQDTFCLAYGDWRGDSGSNTLYQAKGNPDSAADGSGRIWENVFIVRWELKPRDQA